MNIFDVIIIGGGTAGAISAIQSARAGAHILLIEKNGILGGTMTVGRVNFPGLFHAWGRQVITWANNAVLSLGLSCLKT